MQLKSVEKDTELWKMEIFYFFDRSIVATAETKMTKKHDFGVKQHKETNHFSNCNEQITWFNLFLDACHCWVSSMHVIFLTALFRRVITRMVFLGVRKKVENVNAEIGQKKGKRTIIRCSETKFFYWRRISAFDENDDRYFYLLRINKTECRLNRIFIWCAALQSAAITREASARPNRTQKEQMDERKWRENEKEAKIETIKFARRVRINCTAANVTFICRRFILSNPIWRV